MLENTPPPARRTVLTQGSTGVLLPPPSRSSLSSSNVPPIRTASSSGSAVSLSEALPHRSIPTRSQPVDDFNGAFHSAKAFGIATGLVMAGATVTILGVRAYLGVDNTAEFAREMRQAVMTRMPALSSRIHRPPTPEDNEPVEEIPPTGPPPLLAQRGSGEAEWTWPAAERRLTVAFEEKGFSGWATAAFEELEAEGQVERKKRGHA